MLILLKWWWFLWWYQASVNWIYEKFIQQKEKLTPNKFKIKSNNKNDFFFQVMKHIRDISSAVMGERRQEGTC